jgi:hypothetical protein
LSTLFGSLIRSGVTDPSILSDPGVGPLLDPVSIPSSPASLLFPGVWAGEVMAEVGVPGADPGTGCPGGMLSLRPVVTVG